LHWYTSQGEDLSFLQFPANEYEPEHGPLVDVVIAEAQHIFHGDWLTEALVIGVTWVVLSGLL
jgi:hypothetical protein